MVRTVIVRPTGPERNHATAAAVAASCQVREKPMFVGGVNVWRSLHPRHAGVGLGHGCPFMRGFEITLVNFLKLPWAHFDAYKKLTR